MEWFIKKNSTLPVFQIEIDKDGRSGFHNNWNLTGQTVYISLYDEITKKFLISSKPCYLTYSSSTINDDISCYLNYQLTYRETNKMGRYEVQISIIRNDETLVLPLKENVYISVTESFSLNYVSFNNNYEIDRPCCKNS